MKYNNKSNKTIDQYTDSKTSLNRKAYRSLLLESCFSSEISKHVMRTGGSLL